MPKEDLFKSIKDKKAIEFVCSLKEANSRELDLTFHPSNLCFYTNCLNKKDLIFLASLLFKYQHNLSKVVLSNNNINDDCIDILIKILRTNHTIIYINLSGNRLSIIGVQKLLKALSHTKVTHLDLSYNALPVEPFLGYLYRKLIKPVANAVFTPSILLDNNYLQELDISNNIIDQASLKILISLFDTMLALQRLLMNGCILEGETTKSTLYSWLEKHQAIPIPCSFDSMAKDKSTHDSKQKNKKHHKKYKNISSLHKFKQYLRNTYDMYIVDVPSDGNCFFHAVTDQLMGSIAYDELRKFAVRYIEEHRDQYRDFVEGNMSLERYVNYMLQNSAWVDHNAIDALARELHIRIVIIQDNQLHPPIIISPPAFGATIFIGHIYEFHYVSLHLLNGSPSANVAQLLESTNLEEEATYISALPPTNTPTYNGELNLVDPLGQNELDNILGAIDYSYISAGCLA